MTLEEKCYLLSGKDFWQTRSVERLGVPNMTLLDGSHGVRKQAGAGDQLGLRGSAGPEPLPARHLLPNRRHHHQFLGSRTERRDG